MKEYQYGIENPSRREYNDAKQDILQSSIHVGGLNSEDAYDELLHVLYSANTILNFRKQQSPRNNPATTGNGMTTESDNQKGQMTPGTGP